MNTYRVFFIKEKTEVTVKEGTTVLEAERIAGLSPDAPCGGAGKCGKCMVKINGAVEKACQTKITTDIEVEAIEKKSEHRILVKGTERAVTFSPELEILDIEIPPCTVGENSSDWTRLCEVIKSCRKKDIFFQPKLEILPVISRLIKEKNGKARAIISGDQILELKERDDRPVLMAAFDIGTTTVAGYLLDGKTGEQLATASALNTQTEYGADVIMRANYSLEHGTEELSTCIRELLRKLIGALCEAAKKSPEDIYQVSVVGNTCMHHLFLGIVPDSLVHAPYNPAISQGLMFPAEKFHLGIHPGGQLVALPVIAGFVGADTVACLLAVNLEEEKKMTLMIDIGTNGEIVLGNEKRRIACSTAAGPAFEGAKIACGMRGAEGAIEHAHLVNGKLECKVIGGGRPTGICGSGLIDIIACLLDAGVIDESGKLLENLRVVQIDENTKKAYLLADPLESGDGKPVYLSQKDIREVQLAKGAIAAGIALLAEQMGITLEQVEQVYIAGAFGNYMDPAGACRIGMLPGILKDRIIPVGNAAGEGAKLALLNKEELKRAERLARHTEFLELAALPEFQDQFVDELEFPEI